ncbi:MAG: TetR/AcrR family transcriptional regulator [Lachnospiraceae bacterium]|nr:TetR/AcrR family transcriptional regulator [Lachnospiraceae bacterium]
MKRDKETKSKLLQSAKAEFMEKGYMNASLRNICKNAGVTTGALYFFFQDKADLFQAITKETIEGIHQLMHKHYNEELQLFGLAMVTDELLEEHNQDMEAATEIIHQMYLYRDEVLLLLTKSQGSGLENVADIFIEESEKHLLVIAKQMQQVYPDKVLDENFIHWLAHMQIDAFIYMITHIKKEEEALIFMKQMMLHMTSGWYGLFMN